MNPELRDLPIDQRIRLVEAVWDSIAADQGSLTLNEAQTKELDRRLSAYERDGLHGSEAREVLERVRQRI